MWTCYAIQITLGYKIGAFKDSLSLGSLIFECGYMLSDDKWNFSETSGPN